MIGSVATRALAVLLATGCNSILGVHTFGTPDPDAAVGRDVAQDGTHDASGCGAHDEDSDGFSDGCDPCPGWSDATQADTDGDGVGDSCDPALGTGGDAIVLFEPFLDANAWTVQNGTWSALGDRVTTPSSTAVNVLVRALPATIANATIDATVSVAAIPEGASIGIALFAADNSAAGCALATTNGQLTLQLGNGGQSSTVPVTSTSTRFRLRLQHLGDGRFGCSAGDLGLFAAISGFPTTAHTTAIAIDAVNTSASFENVTVYATP